MVVGTRVRSLRPFAGVPVFTEGVVDAASATHVTLSTTGLTVCQYDFWMVAWDLPERPLPEGYAKYDGMPAIKTGIVRDGFNEYELRWLEKVKERP